MKRYDWRSCLLGRGLVKTVCIIKEAPIPTTTILCYYTHNMISLFKKYFPSVLLCALAWSCFGLNVGMIGHEMLMAQEHPQTLAEHEANHECCIMPTSGEESQENALGIDHHNGAANAIIVNSMIYPLLVLLLAVLLPSLSIWRTVDVRISLYVKRWREHWSYFALLWNRLFSRGILHSKIW